jgi:hypothetical protein
MHPASSSRRVLAPPLLLACVAFFSLSALWLLIAVNYRETAWDFAQFYLVAHLPVHAIHDRAVFVQLGETILAPLGVHYYPPFVRPAVFAFVLRPLAWFSYWQAFWIWAGVGLLSYFASVLLLRRRFALNDMTVPFFAMFFPSMFGIVTGQDANTVLLLLLVSLFLLCDGRDVLGGVLLALCAYKFNLILFLPLVLLLKARWTSLIAFLSSVSVLAVASAMLAPPLTYLSLLRTIPAITIGFVPGGLHGAAIRLGNEWSYFPAAAVVGALCVFLIYKLPMLESFCVAIVASLLVTYHATWYDCTVLVLPIAMTCQRAARPVRVALLLIVGLPGAWAMGREFFQVAVELFLLAYLARGAFRAAEAATGLPAPRVVPGG